MKPLTQDQINQLVEIVWQMRIFAEPIGPMHSWWDSIIDCECVLKGRKPALKIYQEDANRLITDCLFVLADRDWQKAHQTAIRLGVKYTKRQPGLDPVANKVVS